MKSISGRAHKEIRFLRPALIPIRRSVRAGERISRSQVNIATRRLLQRLQKQLTYLDDPTLGEERQRESYAVLMRIPWLAPSIRNAIMTHLGKSVARAGRLAARRQIKIYRDAIDRYTKAGVKAPHEKLVKLTDPSIKKWKDFSIEERDQLDKKVDALKMRLYRSSAK
jgi:hypothetical protein